MEIIIQKRAAKYLISLSSNQRDLVMAKINQQATGTGLDVKKLKGRTDYRLRVGALRVIFGINDNIMLVKDIGPRGDVYKGGNK